ncbi:hypothetical protein GCM10011348_15970 [Marinobacterium nitratireducens]|uniref:Uncharacterized protein n=2 Tax=Marinobacterium nitratireducens TaxID=518897 RepID=A0A917ZDY8_9GAMM|nr:hypothetical protein GCM10011348_15970 [Marinobacterium nitratireducens]
MDIFDRLEQVSNKAIHYFNQIKVHYDRETGLARLPKPYENKNQQVVFSRHLKELIEQQILKKVPSHLVHRKRGELVFIINPEFIKCFQYAQAKMLWKTLP